MTNWQERNTRNDKWAGDNTKKILPDSREIQKTTNWQERIQKNITRVQRNTKNDKRARENTEKNIT